MKKLSALLLTALLLCLCLSACGMEKAAMQDDSGYAGAENREGSAEEVLADRKIIKTVTITMQTKDFDGFRLTLDSAVAEYEGYRESANIVGSAYDRNTKRRAVLVLRIPAENLDAFLSEMSGLGNVMDQTEKVQDVTGAYVSLESRIAVLEAEETSLLAMLEAANTFSEILAVRNQLADVQQTLASYRSQLDVYQDRVAYSTVTLTLEEVQRLSQPGDSTVWEEIGEKFSTNLYRIGQGFRLFFIWFVSSLPYLLLWAVLITVVVLILRRILRHTRKRPPASPAPTYQPPYYHYPPQPQAPQPPTAPADREGDKK
ncbi:MAG: DUF4349 domain-containing protein [Eubacteriales bacterium]